jgi:hypothetical protein
MFHYLLTGYIIIYFVFAIFLFVTYARFVPGEEKKGDKPWETRLDLILVFVGFVGMLFLLTNLKTGAVKALWRPVSIALAATHLYLNLKGRLDILRSDETKPEDREVGYADILTVMFLVPSICLNIYYAFR